MWAPYVFGLLSSFAALVSTDKGSLFYGFYLRILKIVRKYLGAGALSLRRFVAVFRFPHRGESKSPLYGFGVCTLYLVTK